MLAVQCGRTCGRAAMAAWSHGLFASVYVCMITVAISTRTLTPPTTGTVCYTEKAEQAQQHPGTKTTINPGEDNRKKQCKPNQTKSNSITMNPRRRHNNPARS